MPDLYKARSWEPELRDIADQLILDIARRGWSADLLDLLMDTRVKVRQTTLTSVVPHVKASAKLPKPAQRSIAPDKQ